MHRRQSPNRPNTTSGNSQQPNVLTLLQSHEKKITQLGSALQGLPNADTVQMMSVELQKCGLRFQKVDNHLQSIQSSLKSALARITDLELIVDSINKQTGGGTELGTVRAMLNEMRDDLSVLKDTTTRNASHLSSLNEEDKAAALKEAVAEVSTANLNVIKEILGKGVATSDGTIEANKEDKEEDVAEEGSVDLSKGREEHVEEEEDVAEEETVANSTAGEETSLNEEKKEPSADETVVTLGDEIQMQEAELESIRKAVGDAVRKHSEPEDTVEDEA